MTQTTETTPKEAYHAHAGEAGIEKILATNAPSSYLTKEDLEGVAEDGRHTNRKRFFFWHLTKKQWIAALVGSLLLLAGVAVLIVFLAVVPAIFQGNIDKVELSLNYMDMKSVPTDPTSNEIDVELSIKVNSHATGSASMDSATATMYYLDKPFGTITLPAQTFSTETVTYDLVIRDALEISNSAVFTSLSKALMADKEVSLTTRATVMAHAMGLTAGGLKFERSLTIKAFNQFTDPAPIINGFNLTDCLTDKYSMLLNATLLNDALVGVGGTGAMNLSVYYQQDYMGQAISTDSSVGLPRGATTMVLRLDLFKTTAVMDTMHKMVNALIASKPVQFSITGNHPYATQAALLKGAFDALNIRMVYTDGLKKMDYNKQQCNIAEMLG